MKRLATYLAGLSLALAAQSALAQTLDADLAALCSFYEVKEDDPEPSALTPTGPRRLWLSIMSGPYQDKMEIFDPTGLFEGASLKNQNFSDELNKFAVVLENGDRIIAFGTDSIEPEKPHRADVGTGRYTEAGELFDERYILTGSCMFFDTEDPEELKREIGILAEQTQ